MTVIVAIFFLSLLICGPFTEASLIERLFATALLFTAVILVAFVTRRPAFALALPTIVFGGILIASTLKFHYLTAPLLAPDLVYMVNKDLFDVATRYPPIMFALIAGAILIPGLLILVWRLDRPVILDDRPASRRRAILLPGAVATAVLLVAIDSPAGPFSDVFEKGMWQTMNDRSYIADFFASFYQTTIRIPPHAAAADTALSWIQDPAENPPLCTTKACAAQRPMKSPQEHPDIISVL